MDIKLWSVETVNISECTFTNQDEIVTYFPGSKLTNLLLIIFLKVDTEENKCSKKQWF